MSFFKKYSLFFILFAVLCIIGGTAVAEQAEEGKKMLVMSEDTFKLLQLFQDSVVRIAGLITAMFLVVFFFLFIHVQQSRKFYAEKEEAEAENERLWSLIGVSPDGFFAWIYPPLEQNRKNRETNPIKTECSRRLAVTLGLYAGTASTFDLVLEAFEPSESARLNLFVSKLRKKGIGFEQEFLLNTKDRKVLVTGNRATCENGKNSEPAADVIWVRDISENITTYEQTTNREKELEKENGLLKLILDTLPLPVWLRDDDLSLTMCNRPYAKAVDAKGAKDAVEKGCELAQGQAAREARALAARARAADEPRTEREHIVINGSRRFMQITETPIVQRIKNKSLLSGGSAAIAPSPDRRYTVGFAEDITSLEDSVIELNRHLLAHNDVLERLGSAIAVFGSDTQLKFYNRSFAKLWQLDKEWLDSYPSYADLLDVLRDNRQLPEVPNFPEYKQEELKVFTSLFEPKEELLHIPDGETLRRVLAPHPLGGILAIYENVTDKLVMERSYNTLIAVQQETLDNLHEAVAVFGSDGKLRLSNPAYANLWNLENAVFAEPPHLSELIEKQKEFFPDEEEWADYRDDMIKLLSDRKAYSGRWERDDGATLDFASVALPDGGLLITYVDVSDSAKVEIALRERNEALAAANRLRSKFIASVSYELRTPLTAIIGFSEVLTNQYHGRMNKKQKEYAEGILSSAHSLQVMVNNVLDLASIEAGQMALKLDAVDIHSMTSSVLSMTKERIRNKRLELDFDCPADIGWMVADEKRIKQALYNLISNSVTFTPSGKSITVSARRQDSKKIRRKKASKIKGDWLIFSVIDEGVGISKKQQESMFDAFVQNKHSDISHNGAGLGLSLVKSFVEMHGGFVDLKSSPEKGTTVKLYIPAGKTP